MIRARSLVFWILLVAFVAASVWWTFHVPYRPERLFQPIPREAGYVGQHRDLVARWDDFYKNPVALSLFMALGLDLGVLKTLSEDEEAHAWFEKLASRDLVLSFVPAMGPRREPVWIATSWLGGGSQRLRWKLSSFKVKGFVRSKPYRGRHYWIVDTPHLKRDRTLTLAIVEGMAIACISWQHEAMCDVLDTYDGLLPSVRERPDFPQEGAWCADTDAPDRGWVDAGGLFRLRRAASDPVRFEFSRLTPTSLEGRLSTAGAFGDLPAPADGAVKADLAAIVGENPIALTIGSSELLSAAGRGNRWLRIAMETAKIQNANEVMISVFGDTLSGRIKGIRVPALMAGVPVVDEQAAIAEAGKLLDRLNARYRWGLIPHEVKEGDLRMYVIESTAQNAYASLTLEEKMAFAAWNKWFLVSSSAESLGRMMRQYRDRRLGGAVQLPFWVDEVKSAGSPAYVWLDLSRGAKTLRLAISAYSLKLLMDDAQKTTETRQRLNEAKAWIDAMEPLGSCRLWLEPGREELMIRFVAGE